MALMSYETLSVGKFSYMAENGNFNGWGSAGEIAVMILTGFSCHYMPHRLGGKSHSFVVFVAC